MKSSFLNSVSVPAIRKVLDGDSYCSLLEVFVWAYSPQGSDFWIQQSKNLTEEGKQALREILRQHELENQLQKHVGTFYHYHACEWEIVEVISDSHWYAKARLATEQWQEKIEMGPCLSSFISGPNVKKGRMPIEKLEIGQLYSAKKGPKTLIFKLEDTGYTCWDPKKSNMSRITNPDSGPDKTWHNWTYHVATVEESLVFEQQLVIFNEKEPVEEEKPLTTSQPEAKLSVLKAVFNSLFG